MFRYKVPLNIYLLALIIGYLIENKAQLWAKYQRYRGALAVYSFALVCI